ncbi:MAG: FkbM family methyltransferase [Nitrospirota bacterium]
MGSTICAGQVYCAIESDRRKLLLRPTSTDAIIVAEVLVKQSYAPLLVILEQLSISVRTVVDAGANIGTFTLFIKEAFPEATVIAVEPEAENFRLLTMIVAANSLFRVHAVRAALWKENALLWIQESFRGSRERELSFTVASVKPSIPDSSELVVEGITVDALLDRYGLEVVDIFKMDIEGAEASIFGSPAAISAFFRRVRVCAIEIHDEVFDRMSFLRAVDELGLQHVQSGETLYIYGSNVANPEASATMSDSAALP